uniref:RRM domain-containing protein n=1 Tax=Ascaris lumbricoides TaxID=6252 RepID=A0A0M3IF33_ASCLU
MIRQLKISTRCRLSGFVAFIQFRYLTSVALEFKRLSRKKNIGIDIMLP